MIGADLAQYLDGRNGSGGSYFGPTELRRGTDARVGPACSMWYTSDGNIAANWFEQNTFRVCAAPRVYISRND